ncbi:transcriptional regulator [Marinococcus halophilus]|jgi:DNA-binding HxlR family transcriptional regulator|uniref:HTH hxlR-type domain-containing protein n=1 Tax=Marinococcus halophilus TaxID=1371 RepID=A0A510Y4J6_MARHA|nr:MULTISPECIES: helix-turn-helix domain-containing protein [Marinococcus]MDZ5781998.1 helix-turn-helix domain-containing protein [Marinococcus luteus]OZT80210.1 transcriptional regulator [Marinococcus halophilus]GEK58265.1 hypothetical protein MHA01_11700 [Marinococcus halophilus]
MKKEVEFCQFQEALGILVGKWKPVILVHLLNDGTQRFSVLKRKMPGITQRMLTKQLRELEDEDIIQRVIYPEIPPKVEYSITEYGRSLEPILEAMHEWGSSHVARKQAEEPEAQEEKLS